MAETITKGELLTSMQVEYEQFEALLSSLNEQQMTMTGVSGA